MGKHGGWEPRLKAAIRMTPIQTRIYALTGLCLGIVGPTTSVTCYQCVDFGPYERRRGRDWPLCADESPVPRGTRGTRDRMHKARSSGLHPHARAGICWIRIHVVVLSQVTISFGRQVSCTTGAWVEGTSDVRYPAESVYGNPLFCPWQVSAFDFLTVV